MTEEAVWLAEIAYQRLRNELAELLRQRAEGAEGGAGDHLVGDSADSTGDHQRLTDRRERDNRIRKLQELLQKAIVSHDPPDDGVAEPGMLLTVRYEEDQESETFLLSHYEEGAYPDDFMTCSPDSPLGSAVLGKKEGDRIEYSLPNGERMQVTLLRAVPYRTETFPVAG
ncbi:GreA/GreB family elongation factor [Pseudonocardia benzenivorans]|uniref:GreA/GreB family elongation factor n=2 Tax=Pseudonocardia TaxID=1847 RepID=F4CR82_PSEUX|nr:GreA/GreB family elongation factor [Pseudonocardia dioxanivorans]AEA24519.1 GreA/GreB family elongation factor [Pseudonocardia dioxanivorans CB1190]GJF04779.1 transcription elongation factor GreA [Pseudonocardia sp. D17]